MAEIRCVHNYIGKLIHYVGGMNQIMGRIVRIDGAHYGIFMVFENPCLVFQNEKGIGYSKLGGDAEVFKPEIMVYHPADKPMEIREIMPGGELEKGYFREINRRKPEYIKIVTPGVS